MPIRHNFWLNSISTFINFFVSPCLPRVSRLWVSSVKNCPSFPIQYPAPFTFNCKILLLLIRRPPAAQQAVGGRLTAYGSSLRCEFEMLQKFLLSLSLSAQQALAIGSWLLALGSWLSATGYRLAFSFLN